jgi:hypothetical protein
VSDRDGGVLPHRQFLAIEATVAVVPRMRVRRVYIAAGKYSRRGRMQSQPLVCSIARPCTVLLLYRAVLHLRKRTYPAKCGKCDQRRRIGLNMGQVCDVLAQMILEHKQGRSPDLESETRSGRSIPSRWMRAKWPYSYMRIHFSGIRTHTGYDQASGSRGQIEDGRCLCRFGLRES